MLLQAANLADLEYRQPERKDRARMGSDPFGINTATNQVKKSLTPKMGVRPEYLKLNLGACGFARLNHRQSTVFDHIFLTTDHTTTAQLKQDLTSGDAVFLLGALGK